MREWAEFSAKKMNL